MLKFKKKRNVLLIHGAWSNKNSFNYIQELLDHDNLKDTIVYEYNCHKQDIDEIVKNAKKKLSEDNIPTIVVGHSMGGLIALALHDHSNCEKIVTLASPLSGIKIDAFFSAFVYKRAPILKELSPFSSFIDFLQNQKYTKPINCLVACKGFNPFMLEPSDGVVTIESQEKWVPQSAVTTHVDASHNEIIQTQTAVNAIKNYLK